MNCRFSIHVVLLLALVGALPGARAEEPLSADEIRELRGLLKHQQEQIEEMRAIQAEQAEEIEELKRQLPGAPAEAPPAAPPPVATAEPAAVPDVHIETTPPGGTLSFGGAINRTINFVDDGNGYDEYFVDSANFPTLLYLRGSKKINDDLTVGGNIEVAVQNNSAVEVNQQNREAGLNISSRFLEATLDSSRYGKLYFGRGFMSSAYIWELDQSDTWYYNQLSAGSSFAGILFAKEDGSLSDIPVAAVYLDAEAFAFRDRVRYDTPVWQSLQASASFGSGDSGAYALKWDYDGDDMKLVARTSLQLEPRERVNFIGSRIDDRWDGGLGLFHKPSGLSLSGVIGEQTFKQEFLDTFNRVTDDSFGYVARVGWRGNPFGIGETKLALDYFRTEDALYDGDEGDSYGIYFGQQIADWHLEPYVGYRHYDYDSGPNAEDSFQAVDGFAVGLLYKFDFTAEVGSQGP